MALTAVTYTKLVANGNVEEPTGTTLATGGHTIASAEPERTILVVANTDSATDLTVTVAAGDSPPALAAGQGSKVVTVPFGHTEYIGPFESARFLQDDGSLTFTPSTATGTVVALLIPKGV